MKLIKLTPYLLILIFITGCNSPERSVGFNDWSDDGKEYKFHLGTEASIDIVKKFDQISQNRDYDKMNEIFSDTTVITYQNGVNASLQDFIGMNKSRDSMLDSNNATLKWDLLRAFSVDIDPSRGGEHVHAAFKGSYNDSETVETFYANLWFYIIDGKIITVNQYNQDIID